MPFLETPSPETKHFYVSAIDGPKKYLLAGPYETHEAAKAQVDAVLRVADKQNPKAWFMAWGTCGSVEPLKTPLGPNWKEAT